MSLDRECQIEDGCQRNAPFDLISRNDDGTELGRLPCCFFHGIRIVNINYYAGSLIPDCVVAPISDREDVTV